MGTMGMIYEYIFSLKINNVLNSMYTHLFLLFQVLNFYKNFLEKYKAASLTSLW